MRRCDALNGPADGALQLLEVLWRGGEAHFNATGAGNQTVGEIDHECTYLNCFRDWAVAARHNLTHEQIPVFVFRLSKLKVLLRFFFHVLVH